MILERKFNDFIFFGYDFCIFFSLTDSSVPFIFVCYFLPVLIFGPRPPWRKAPTHHHLIFWAE